MKSLRPNSLKLFGISGSLRINASSTMVLNRVKEMFGPDVQFEMDSGIGTLPHFNDADIASPEVNLFRAKIRAADGVIICQPEYAFGVSGSLKNALDWTVGSGEFNSKPVALITTATGGEAAHAAMTKTLQAIDCNLLGNTNMVISFIKSKINKEGVITDQQVEASLIELVDAFKNEVEKLKQE
jgi:chromate reductase, NAD(P)H dehydrogenase (quinone)